MILEIAKDFYQKLDLHIHVPEGAIPKDGPSAGITMATSIVSALTQIPVYCDLAMTGEITLRGKVLPIGGIKEKLLAAHRVGICRIILPKDNQKDLADIPANILEQFEINLVENMDEVLKIALTEEPTPLDAAEAFSPAALTGTSPEETVYNPLEKLVEWSSLTCEWTIVIKSGHTFPHSAACQR